MWWDLFKSWDTMADFLLQLDISLIWNNALNNVDEDPGVSEVSKDWEECEKPKNIHFHVNHQPSIELNQKPLWKNSKNWETKSAFKYWWIFDFQIIIFELKNKKSIHFWSEFSFIFSWFLILLNFGWVVNLKIHFFWIFKCEKVSARASSDRFFVSP